ncbi:kynurenine-oxoglutarate transaminase [Aphelenchoides avenae]|nr:kynurenine-oxoglutarate transaminase [Aphelenchus avenae]
MTACRQLLRANGFNNLQAKRLATVARAPLVAVSGSSTWRQSDLAKRAPNSLWLEFTTLAAECKAVNLGQGFPDTPIPKFIADHLRDIGAHPERTDWHQYTRGYGHPRLVNALGTMYSTLLGVPVAPATDILVTVGAYMALYYTMLAWLNEGDEVLVLEPAFDSYIPQIRMAGGVPVPIVLELRPNATTSADYILDLEAVEAKISSRTKMLILNNPQNPTGKLFPMEELAGIAALAEKYNLIVVSDEVYEWHVYPGKEMIRFASLPGTYDRTITVGSAGKAFSITGWHLGWAMGPDHLLAPLKRIHQNCISTCATPLQEAVARAFEEELALWDAGRVDQSFLRTQMVAELLPKRSRLLQSLRKAGFKPLIPDAGYFIMADFSAFDGPFLDDPTGDPLDYRFARWLCREKKLAAIPPSAFYSPKHKSDNDSFVRFCFFKKDETLAAAEEILAAFSFAKRNILPAEKHVRS